MFTITKNTLTIRSEIYNILKIIIFDFLLYPVFYFPPVSITLFFCNCVLLCLLWYRKSKWYVRHLCVKKSVICAKLVKLVHYVGMTMVVWNSPHPPWDQQNVPIHIPMVLHHLQVIDVTLPYWIGFVTIFISYIFQVTGRYTNKHLKVNRILVVNFYTLFLVIITTYTMLYGVVLCCTAYYYNI